MITKLEAAPEGSRELDAEIDRYFGLTVDDMALSGPWTRYPTPDHYRGTNHYTTSVDAAIALARREWPDMMYRIGNDGEGPEPDLIKAEIIIFRNGNCERYVGISRGDALALCIAILKAKEASHERT